MQYLLLIYGDESGAESPEEARQMMKEYGEYTEWLRDTGRFVGGEALEPSDQATTVQVRDGKTLTTDGPYAETKEHLGGYFLIQSDHLDDAIEAAAKIPGARTGSIEIRPIFDYTAGG